MSAGLVHKCTWTLFIYMSLWSVCWWEQFIGLNQMRVWWTKMHHTSTIIRLCASIIINFSFNLPKASNMKRVMNKLWKNVCSLLFNNGGGGRKMEGEKMKRIGIFVIMRGILIFGVRNVHFKPWNILLIKKRKKEKIEEDKEERGGVEV